MTAAIQPLSLDLPVQVSILREDLLFPEMSGNKYRKLKYNLDQARFQGHKTLLTFGGAFSNHIDAVSAAGQRFGFKTIGLIRGEEAALENPTLSRAAARGMQLHFIDRETYRQKTSPDFIKTLQQRFGDFYLLPEGGTNELAVAGCAEILSGQTNRFDYICCAVGTGGTLAGLAKGAADHQQIIGFPALKADLIETEIEKLVTCSNWHIQRGYEFGGYAKISKELIAFMNGFYQLHKIPTDPVYTAKMLYGVFDMIDKGHFSPNSSILVVHTGGLQGIAGMNHRLKKSNLPQIDYV